VQGHQRQRGPRERGLTREARAQGLEEHHEKIGPEHQREGRLAGCREQGEYHGRKQDQDEGRGNQVPERGELPVLGEDTPFPVPVLEILP